MHIKKASKYFIRGPEIIDGSNINIGSLGQVEQFDLNQYVADMTTLWADLSQTYLMLVLAFRQ